MQIAEEMLRSFGKIEDGTQVDNFRRHSGDGGELLGKKRKEFVVVVDLFDEIFHRKASFDAGSDVFVYLFP